jgi:hypothetical protein
MKHGTFRSNDFIQRASSLCANNPASVVLPEEQQNRN